MLPGGGRGSQGNIDGSDGSRGDGSDSGRGGGSDASHGGGHAGRRGVSTGGGRGGGRVGVGRGGSDASHGGGHAGGRGVSIGGGRGGGRVGVGRGGFGGGRGNGVGNGGGRGAIEQDGEEGIGRGGFGGGRGNGVGNGGGRGAIGEGGVEGVGRGGLGGVHRGGFGGGRGNGFVNGRGRGAIGEDGVEGVGRGGFGGIHHGGLGGGRGNGVVNGGGRGGIGVDGGPQGGVQGVGRGGFVGGGRGHGRGIIPHHRSIDALTESEARRLMPVLNPNRENGALWFEFDNAPRRVIVAAIRRHFDGPWFNMSSVPNETIIQWWGEFIQAFWWDQEHVALVYSYWYSITAARLRDMISKVRKGLERPYWISLVTWDAMSSYWNTTEAKEKSRIAAANRMSNRDGFGRHAHTSGARSYNQVRELIRQRDGIEPSMLQLLRETHRRVDGTYVDGRAQSIDEEINRQVRTTALGSETQSLDGTGATGLSQHEEDELYFKVVTPTQGGRVYGLGGQHAIRERGESSSMGASRLTLERQVNAMQEQLTSVVNLMKQFMEQNAETNRSSSPRTTPTSGRVNANDLESSLEAETRVVNGVSNRSTPKEHEANEEDDSIEEDDEEGNDDYAAY